jgi:hypothetical protein
MSLGLLTPSARSMVLYPATQRHSSLDVGVAAESSTTLRLLLPGLQRTAPWYRAVNIMFWARRGEGKTLSVVWLLAFLQKVMRQAGWSTLANFQIDFADFCDPLLGQQLNENRYIAERSLVAIDEVTELLPSVRATSEMALLIGGLLRQVRKLPAAFVSDTQFPTDVVSTLRRQTDIYIMCRSHIPKDSRWNAEHARRSYVEWYIFDVWGQWTGNGLAATYWPPPIELADKRIVIYNLPLVWNHYSTDEQVASQYGSQRARDQVIRRSGWDARKLEEQRLGVQNSDMSEYEAELQASLKNPRTLARLDTLPVEAHRYDLPPANLEGYIKNKSLTGLFPISKASLYEVKKFAPEITTVKALIESLEAHGVTIVKQGRTLLGSAPAKPEADPYPNG